MGLTSDGRRTAIRVALACLAGAGVATAVLWPRPLSRARAAAADAPPSPPLLPGLPAGYPPEIGHTTPDLLPPLHPAAIVLAQRKRVMGRRASWAHIARTAVAIRPLIDAALRRPEHQAALRALSSGAGMDVDQYRAFFAAKQEADLLLESGGDPDAISSARACGVAQFLASTGRKAGLRVDLTASNRLTTQIAGLDRSLAWLAKQPAEFSRPGVGSVNWTRDEWIRRRTAQRAALATRRRRIDHRFDPEKAIPVQTRYLLSLTRRFGGIDWALQAYHGGEAGASRLRALVAPARSRLASRGLRPGFHGYAITYSLCSPSDAPAAFGYLFGRSDDHRYYWWKVLMAEQALNLFRADRDEFDRQWRSLRPGEGMVHALYPNLVERCFQDDEALRTAYAAGELIRLPGGAGWRTAPDPSLRPELAHLFKGLRPEAMGALVRLERVYRRFGGRSPLVLDRLVQSADYARSRQAREQPDTEPDASRQPDPCTSGYLFTLRPPVEQHDRKVLTYALGRFYDSLRLSWWEERDAAGRRYLVVVNPYFREEFTLWARQLSPGVNAAAR